MRISDWSSDVCSSDLHVDELARHEVGSGQLLPHFEQRVVGDAELDDAALRLHLRLGEVAALRLGHPVRLGLERAELDRVIAVLLGGAHRHHLAIFHLQRSEEHTSELQSLMRISYAVFCLKKKNNHKSSHISNINL